MALSVDYNYRWILKLIRKNQAGGLSDIEFNNHWNDAQGSYEDDLLGRFQKNNNSKEGINTGLIENETIMNKLLPFTKPVVGLAVVGGQAVKPSDWIFTLALRINGVKVFQIDKDEIWAVNEDVIDPPSITDDSYYYTEYQNYYSILPSSVSALDLDYIATTTDVVWAFDLVAGRQVYNSTNSVQPLWDNNSCREISKRVLATLGVSFKDEDFSGFGERVLNVGE